MSRLCRNRSFCLMVCCDYVATSFLFSSKLRLYVEAEVHDVAVLHHIVLTLYTHLACLADSSF